MADLVRFKYTDGTKTITPTNLNAGDLILDTSNRKLYARKKEFGLPGILDANQADISTLASYKALTTSDKKTYTISVNVYDSLVQEMIDNEEVVAAALNVLNTNLENADTSINNLQIVTSNQNTSISNLNSSINSLSNRVSTNTTNIANVSSRLLYTNLAYSHSPGVVINTNAALADTTSATIIRYESDSGVSCTVNGPILPLFCDYSTIADNTTTIQVNPWVKKTHIIHHYASPATALTIYLQAGGIKMPYWDQTTILLYNPHSTTLSVTIPYTYNVYKFICTNPGHTIGNAINISVSPKSWLEINLMQTNQYFANTNSSGFYASTSSISVTPIIINYMGYTTSSTTTSSFYQRIVFVRYAN